MNTYDIGDVIRLTAEFTDTANVAADPSAVTIKIKSPDGEVASKSGNDIVKDETGQYHYDFTVEQSGYHHYRAEGTGDVTAAAETSFRVRKSNVLSE